MSSGLAVGQSYEPVTTPEVPHQPTWLESLWNLPVFKWLSGLDATPIEPPQVVIATPPPPPCAVQGLAAVDDPVALLMEANAGGGSPLNLDGLTRRTSTALARFERIVESRGGTFTLTSAYRPSTYQAHLRNVWFKWIYELKDNQDPSCADLKAEVGAEFERHGLLASQHPVEVSDHTLGIGFDAAISLPAGLGKKAKRRRISLDRLARLAGVSRPDIRRDPVHFRLIGGRG